MRHHIRGHLVRALVLTMAVSIGAAGCNKTSSSTTAEDACGLKIAFFGALTGSAANLGINIEQAFELAMIQYNDQHPDCQVEIGKVDSQGAPDNAPGLARQLVSDPNLIGIIGPAFSGESIAAEPDLRRGGHPSDHAVCHPVGSRRPGVEGLPSGRGQR